MKIGQTSKEKCAEVKLYFIMPQANRSPTDFVESGRIIMCDVRMWTSSNL